MNVTGGIEGMRELSQLFRILPDRIDAKVAKQVSRRGGRVVVKEARKRTPVGETQNLKRSIQVITPRKRANHVLVGANVKGGTRGKGFHAHFLAEGTAKRKTKSGANRGKMRAQGNWIGEAADSVKNQVFAEMKREAVPLIEKEMAKLAYRG
jgi:HK97 gp10 family phage protein